MPDFPKVATPKDVWEHAVRTLTGFTGTPRINLLGEDADFEAGTGTRKVRIDRLANMPAEEAPVEETWDYLTTDTYPHSHSVTWEPSVYGRLEGFIDLSELVAGEAVKVREEMSIVTPVSYKAYYEKEYSGVQALPLLFVLTRPARYGIKVTMTMETAPAADRFFRVQWFKRRIE